MRVTRRLTQWGAARLARRLAVSMPIAGAAVALAAAGGQVRRKGWLRGALDVALNAIPYLGAAKNLAEAVRGDFIPDRARVARSTPPPPAGSS